MDKYDTEMVDMVDTIFVLNWLYWSIDKTFTYLKLLSKVHKNKAQSTVNYEGIFCILYFCMDE